MPLDYGHAAGPTITLAVIRHRATSGNRIGSVVLNPGGPGGSGVQFLKSAWHAYDQLLQSRFDVVSFDPRGVGASDPIRCVPSTLEDQYVSYDVDPKDAAEVAHQKQLNDEFGAGCEKMSAQLLPHVGTPETARDLDVLRAALGDDKLTYIGESYGTFLGAIYAELFPTKIRAFVLDGVVDPTLNDVSEAQGQAVGFETELHAFIANCVSHGGCALGSSSSDAESKLDAWLDTLTAKPLKGGGRALTKMLAVSGIAAALYTPQSWDTLNSALGKAMKGNPSGMFVLADDLTGRRSDGSYSNELEANVAINCADRGTSLPSMDAAAQSALASEKDGPTFGEILGWGDSTCIGWPVPGELSPG
ncbi:MAG: alpha/beta fold hydrolase, partial [bacterium]